MITLERLAEFRVINTACTDTSFRAEMAEVFDAAERALLIDELRKAEHSRVQFQEERDGRTVIHFQAHSVGNWWCVSDSDLLSCLRQAVVAKRDAPPEPERLA